MDLILIGKIVKRASDLTVFLFLFIDNITKLIFYALIVALIDAGYIQCVIYFEFILSSFVTKRVFIIII